MPYADWSSNGKGVCSRNRLEDSNIDHDGVISAMEATNLVLEYNVVSGGERVCFHVAPQSCEAVSGL
jgi:hypothetical protein